MVQSNNEILKFQTLVKEHKSANHILFDCIEEAAKDGTLTKEMYYLFAVNIATRTMLSLPEIHACCIQAALDLDPLRTAYSVMTGAEEGGAGNPKEVHSILMMNALNYHGEVIFNLEPIDLKYLMVLVRLLHALKKYSGLVKLEEEFEGVNNRLNLFGFVNNDELNDIIIRMSHIAGIEISLTGLPTISTIEKAEIAVNQKLVDAKVLPQTIDYCLAQIDILVNMQTGYLQGVGFAHEALADGMLYKMFRILYSQVDEYSSQQDFIEKVYPYFSAHGNYIEVYNGLADLTEGVEVTHAQRELEKLASLDDKALAVAWVGANDFANRNVKIWDGLLNEIEMNMISVHETRTIKWFEEC